MIWWMTVAFGCDAEAEAAKLDALVESGDLPGAVVQAESRLACAQAIEQDVDAAWYDLAWITEAAGDFDGSVPAWVEASKRLPPGPDRSSAWLRIGLHRFLTDGSGQDDLQRAVDEAAPGTQRTDAQIWLAKSLSKAGRAAEAIELIEAIAAETDEERARVQSTASLAWYQLALERRDAGDPQGALEASRRSLEIVQSTEGIDRVMAELAYGQRLVEAGQAQAALPHLELAQQAFANSAPGSEGDWTASSSLARALSMAGHKDEALEMAQRAVAITRQTLGPQHPQTAETLRGLASIHADRREYEEALDLFAAASNVLSDALGTEHPDVLLIEHDRILALHESGNPVEALEAVGPLLEAWRRSRGSEHLDTIASEKLRCHLLRATGSATEAVSCSTDARERLEALMGPHPLVVGAILDQALAVEDIGRPARALELLDAATALQDQLEPDPERTGAMEIRRIALLMELGRYDEADQRLGEEPGTGMDEATWLRLRGEWWTQVRPAEGIPFLERALKLTTDPIPRSALLTALGTARHSGGDIEGGERALSEALEVSEVAFGEHDPRHAPILANLGAMYLSRGAIIEGTAAYGRIFEEFESAGIRAHPLMGVALSELSKHDREYEKALVPATLSVDILNASLGPDNPKTAAAERILASILCQLDRKDECIAAIRRAEAAFSTSLGPESSLAMGARIERLALEIEHHPGPDTRADFDAMLRQVQDTYGGTSAEGVHAMHTAGLTLLRLGDHNGAKQILQEGMRQEAALIENAMVGPDRMRLQAVKRGGNLMRIYLAAEEDPAAALVTAGTWSGIASRAYVGESAESEEIADLSTRIAGLTYSPPMHLSASERREAMAELLEQRDALEGRRKAKVKRRRLKTACRRLEDDELLLAYFFGAASDVDDIALRAYVTGRDCRVRTVELDAAAVLEAHKRYRKVAEGLAGRLADRVGGPLREALWDPVVPLFEGHDKISVHWDPSLANISLAGLPDRDGGYLVEHYRLRTLASIWSARPDGAVSLERPVVIGGVDYAGEGDAPPASTRAGCGWSAFGPLPGSDAEATAIAERVPTARVLRAEDARERAIRSAVEDASIVHLATHGFHADEGCSFVPESDGYGVISTEQLVSGLNPMLVTGLALAGANERGTDGADDGIWTAAEVAGARTEAELVVLSACESGLGTVAPGEGVLGLQRGFQQAGAEQVVHALWRVPDEATKQLMEAFYDGLTDGMGPAEALQHAQIQVLEHSREAKGEGRPMDWAAFVLGR